MMKMNEMKGYFGGILIVWVLIGACTNTGNRNRSNKYGTKSIDSAQNLNRQKFLADSLNRQSSNYLVKAYSNSLFTIKLSKAAIDREVHPATHRAATFLIEKQSDFNKKTAHLAENLNISVPENIGNKQEKKLDRLKNNDGFEEHYFRTLLDLHEKTLRILKEAENSSKTAIKDWGKENRTHYLQYIDTITTGQKIIDSL